MELNSDIIDIKEVAMYFHRHIEPVVERIAKRNLLLFKRAGRSGNQHVERSIW
jgi:hypothetical protein